MRTIKGLRVVTLVAACVAGCGDVTEPIGDPEDNAVGETRQTLGEIGCGTVAITPGSVQGTILPGHYGSCTWTSSSVSPNAEYGSASCPGQYVVEFTNTGSSTEARPYVAVPGQPDQIACATTRVEMGVYGKRPVFVIGPDGHLIVTWRFVLVGTRIAQGQWIPEIVGPLVTLPAHCMFTTVSDTIPSDWKVSNHPAVRVAGRATRLFWKLVNGVFVSVRLPLPVEVGLRDSNPC